MLENDILVVAFGFGNGPGQSMVLDSLAEVLDHDLVQLLVKVDILGEVSERGQELPLKWQLGLPIQDLKAVVSASLALLAVVVP